MSEPGNTGSYVIQTFIDILISTVYLVDIVDMAGSFGTHCRNQQGGPGLGASAFVMIEPSIKVSIS